MIDIARSLERIERILEDDDGEEGEADYERRDLMVRNAENLRQLVLQEQARRAARDEQPPRSS